MKYSNQFFVSFCNKYGFKTIKQYLDYIGDYLNDLNIAAMNNKDNALYDIKSNYIKFLYTNDFIAEPLYLAGVQGVNEPLLTFKIGKHTFHQPTRLCKYIEFLKLKHDTTKFSKTISINLLIQAISASSCESYGLLPHCSQSSFSSFGW